MPDFWGHVVDATLPVLKICLLGAVGAALSRTVGVAALTSLLLRMQASRDSLRHHSDAQQTQPTP